jgi:hypothetical protein
MDLKWDWGEPASAKYTVLEKSTTPGKEKQGLWRSVALIQKTILTEVFQSRGTST